jgi:hypothetical protein
MIVTDYLLMQERYKQDDHDPMWDHGQGKGSPSSNHLNLVVNTWIESRFSILLI